MAREIIKLSGHFLCLQQKRFLMFDHLFFNPDSIVAAARQCLAARFCCCCCC